MVFPSLSFVTMALYSHKKELQVPDAELLPSLRQGFCHQAENGSDLKRSDCLEMFWKSAAYEKASLLLELTFTTTKTWQTQEQAQDCLQWF